MKVYILQLSAALSQDFNGFSCLKENLVTVSVEIRFKSIENKLEVNRNRKFIFNRFIYLKILKCNKSDYFFLEFLYRLIGKIFKLLAYSFLDSQ